MFEQYLLASRQPHTEPLSMANLVGVFFLFYSIGPCFRPFGCNP
jgi:hypothetical protein